MDIKYLVYSRNLRNTSSFPIKEKEDRDTEGREGGKKRKERKKEKRKGERKRKKENITQFPNSWLNIP